MAIITVTGNKLEFRLTEPNNHTRQYNLMVEAHENLTQLVKKAQNNGNSLNSCFKRPFFGH